MSAQWVVDLVEKLGKDIEDLRAQLAEIRAQHLEPSGRLMTPAQNKAADKAEAKAEAREHPTKPKVITKGL
jgi:hypothetical protein